jgi:hypothetical protein
MRRGIFANEADAKRPDGAGVAPAASLDNTVKTEEPCDHRIVRFTVTSKLS